MKPAPVEFLPIGVIRSPFTERVEAPRQPAAASEGAGTIELYPGRHFEHALCDLERWRYMWVIYWFHLNRGFRPKVRPPRSLVSRGVFATRSPRRPNPIGLSVYELVRVDGLILHVRGVDALDGTPVLDLKPYVAYTDALPEAGAGWLDARDDRGPHYEVCFSERAREQLSVLAELGLALGPPLEQALSLGPAPHPYRRIKRDEKSWLIAVKDWRARFEVEAERLRVTSLFTGYAPKQLAEREDLRIARIFVERFGYPGD